VEWWDVKEKPKIYNKSGELSEYGFTCGYVQSRRSEHKWKKMFMEHSHFHVMSGKTNETYEIWDTFEYLSDARKYYKSIKI
jgi:hypothetical protein